MREINWAELWENRNRLVTWQAERRQRPSNGELRLNAGCGDLKWPTYTGVDLYPPADILGDFRKLDQLFDGESVDEIVSQHALEHIPFVEVVPTLTGFYNVLKPRGTLELGMPDAELCCIDFITATEEKRWTTCEDEIWGLPVTPGMAHHCGLTLSKAVEILTKIGFTIEQSYNYDANSVAPSLFVFARKPCIQNRDIIAGVYTHRTTYLGDLAISMGQHAPDLPFLVHIQDGTVGENMERLRQKFKASGLRYWLFLDDDTRLCNSQVLWNALSLLQRPEVAAVSAWPEGSPHFQDRPVYTDLVYGYFILVDSQKVGHIAFDNNIPDIHAYFDVDYCLSIAKAGYRLVMLPYYISHLQVSGFRSPSEQATEYIKQKWPDVHIGGQARYGEML